MLKISLEGLQVLDAIDRRGSIAGASTELHRVPSTISYAVAKLEQDLGVAVYERAGPRITLTPAGRELLKEGRYLLKAAQDLEHRVRRVATGWETQFAIGVESLLAPSALADDIRAFYDVADSTRLRITQEVMSGMWEALLDRRVDLLIAAAGEGPSGGGYVFESMGTLPFVFAVAPHHPLAAASEPIDDAELIHHRAVAVADSAHRLTPITVNLLPGQDVLTVSDMHAKIDALLRSLGCGFVPEPMARDHIAAGWLVVKSVQRSRIEARLGYAWRTPVSARRGAAKKSQPGLALRWWLDQLESPTTRTALLERHGSRVGDRIK